MRTMPAVCEHDVFALLENTRALSNTPDSLLFTEPVSEVSCVHGTELPIALAELDRLRRSGLYVCGYIAYEAGYFLADKSEFRFPTQPTNDSPLLHFYAFRNCHSLTSDQAGTWLSRIAPAGIPVAIRNPILNMSKEDYLERISKIKDYIRAGDTYQVNFTLKYQFDYQGGALPLYQRLRERQRVEFGAVLNFPEFRLLSLSPELFIRKEGSSLEAKPMKGTHARGSTADEDMQIVRDMRRDPKTLSENVMIVDLLRNDVSRVAQAGSVSVKNLFEVQTYETLHQMISTVQGSIGADTPLGDVFAELFPCGSITGAPKIRTMQVIEELEAEDRGVYTGAIGYLTPENNFCFNVPIRTCVAYPDGSAEMGVGGGVLYESDPRAEFDECLLKARFLTGVNSAFQLLESMRYEGATGSVDKIGNHLERLRASASALGFSYNQEAVLAEIARASRGLEDDHKIRLTLDQDGKTAVSMHPLPHAERPAQRLFVDLSDVLIERDQFLLQHKTTERRVYEQEYTQHAANGAYDVLFMNEAGNITEASRHNVFVEKNGQLFTSPADEGLLPGIERQALLSRAKAGAIERPLAASDLLSADRLLLTNSVRGVVEVELSEQARTTLSKLAMSEQKDAVSN